MIWLLLPLFLAGLWQLATWTELLIRTACDALERRIAAHRAPYVPHTRPLPMPAVTGYQLLYWNGCRAVADSSCEQGRLAVLSAMLGNFDFHKRPSA